MLHFAEVMLHFAEGVQHFAEGMLHFSEAMQHFEIAGSTGIKCFYETTKRFVGIKKGSIHGTVSSLYFLGNILNFAGESVITKKHKKNRRTGEDR